GDKAALSTILERAGVQLQSELEARISPIYRGLLDADDVIQATFLEAFLRVQSFKPTGPGSFLSWLRRISDNNLRDAIRELERDKRPPPAKRVTASASEDSYALLLETIAGTTTTASRAMARGEVKVLLDQALAKLPPDYRQVLKLYELEGLS